MTGLRVNDVLRLYEGEPGGVEAIPVGSWWTLKVRSVIFSNESIPVLSMFWFVKTPRLDNGQEMGCGCWAVELLGC